MTKYQSLFEDFSNALERLKEVLEIPEPDDIVRDSAIKRFEIVFDLGWKCAKAFLEQYMNVSCSSPRGCFRELFRQGLIEHEDFWIEVADTRNYTAHTYSELLANTIFLQLPEAQQHFQGLALALRKRCEEEEHR